MKVFISMPFHGRTEKEVLTEMETIRNLVQEKYPEEKVTVIDNYHKANAPMTAGRLWYLGDSIRLMDKADIVVFAENWMNAKGCLCEHTAASLYDKKKMFVLGGDLFEPKDLN